MSLAIIWPANPRAVELHQQGDPGIHLELLRNQAAVYWDSMPRRRELENPLYGYIYFNNAVRYRCRGERMINHETLLRRMDEHCYVQSFRRQCLFGQWENSERHPPSETWIKILQIERGAVKLSFEFEHFGRLLNFRLILSEDTILGVKNGISPTAILIKRCNYVDKSLIRKDSELRYFSDQILWRRGWDSNPRGPEGSTGSQGLRIIHSATPALPSHYVCGF